MDTENPEKKIRTGQLKEFLHRNKFRVELYNGVNITAVMPDDLLPAFDVNVPLSHYVWQYVEVELREAPLMPKIVSIQPRSELSGS